MARELDLLSVNETFVEEMKSLNGDELRIGIQITLIPKGYLKNRRTHILHVAIYEAISHTRVPTDNATL